MKRKLFLLLCALLTMIGVTQVKAQASFNHTYTEGVTVAAGTDYFLYNIESGTFLTGGMDWGSHAAGDHAGKLVELQSEGGAYYLYTNYASANGVDNPGYLTAGDVYADNGGAEKAAYTFTSVEVDGYTNAYTLTTGGKYLFYDATNTKVNLRDEDSDNYSKWLLIPKSARDAVGDYTYYLQNVGINRFWERACWAGCTWGNDNVFATGGNADNPCGEKYHGALDFYQQITAGVPNGLYKLYCQGFWRQDGTDAAPVLYANNDTKEFSPRTGTENSMAEASTSFSAGNYVNSMETVVTDGSLRVGINITSGSQWVIFDNFTLDYIGRCVVNDADALPDGGAMTAGKWYYFDIATTADNYAATANDLSSIICTNDGKQLTAEATGNITLTAKDNSLEAGRYYVKSSTDNSLVIAVASFTYNLGDAVLSASDGSYIQNNILTVTFPDAGSNDPDASLTLIDNAKATVNGVEVALEVVSNGFSLSLGELATSTDYAISIPADVYGYVGEVMNEAINMTLHTPAVVNGVYYLYDATNKLFLGRGANYSTRAVADKYGVPMTVATNTSGITTFKFLDNELNLFDADDGNLYTDNTSYPNFAIVATTGGYYVVNKNTRSKSTYDGKLFIDGSSNVIASMTSSTVWTLLTDAERDAIVDAYPTDNINTVIAAAGISTTAAEFESFLATNYGATDKTNLIGTAKFTGSRGDWTWTQVKSQGNQPAYGTNFAEIWQATGTHSQTVGKANLPAGIYKLTVDGFERRATNAKSTALGDAGYNVVSSYLAANDEQVRLTDWYNTSKPNNTGGAVTAFNNGEATNVLYIYLDGNTDLSIKLAKPNFVGDCWTIFNNFTLTYYEAKATPAEKAALADAIAAAEAKTPGFEEGEYAPYNNQEAFAALAAAKAIIPETASGEAVVNATTALTGATWTANAEQLNAIYWPVYTNESAKDAGNRIYAIGWGKNGGTDAYNTRVVIGTTESNVGVYNNLSNHEALMTKFNTNYGVEVGYTMPLKANTLYKLSFKYGGMENKPEVTVSFTDPSSDVITLAPNFVPTEANAHTSAVDKFDVYEGYFVTNEAGNYVLNLSKNPTTQQQIAMGNIELVKVASQTLTITDGEELPKFAPGTYPSATYTRTIPAESKYGTICLPFNVKSDENITFYNLQSVEGTTLNLTSADEGVAAGVPAVFKKLTADATEISVTTANAEVVAAPVAQVGDTKLVGTFSDINVSENVEKCYYIMSNAFWQGNGNFNVKAYRAYIQTDVNEARLIIKTDGEDPTAINAIEAAEAEEGVLKDGKYLIDGKVIIVKNGVKYGANGQKLN